MDKNTVYTIGRKFGSGGKDVGKALADKLGIPFYNDELIAKATKESGICEEVMRKFDEKTPMNVFHPYWSAPFLSAEPPLGQQIFLSQFHVIEKIAEEGGAVIVGRCADYVLRNRKNLVSVFIYASPAVRAAKISKDLGVSEEEALKQLPKADKERASYYNFFTDKKWGDASSYDLSMCSDFLSVDDMVELICMFAGKKK